MSKYIRHRDEILKQLTSDIHNEATDETTYQQIRDTVMIEVLVDIRDNLHHIAKNLQPEYDED